MLVQEQKTTKIQYIQILNKRTSRNDREDDPEPAVDVRYSFLQGLVDLFHELDPHVLQRVVALLSHVAHLVLQVLLHLGQPRLHVVPLLVEEVLHLLYFVGSGAVLLLHHVVHVLHLPLHLFEAHLHDVLQLLVVLQQRHQDPLQLLREKTKASDLSLNDKSILVNLEIEMETNCSELQTLLGDLPSLTVVRATEGDLQLKHFKAVISLKMYTETNTKIDFERWSLDSREEYGLADYPAVSFRFVYLHK